MAEYYLALVDGKRMSIPTGTPMSWRVLLHPIPHRAVDLFSAKDDADALRIARELPSRYVNLKDAKLTKLLKISYEIDLFSEPTAPEEVENSRPLTAAGK